MSQLSAQHFFEQIDGLKGESCAIQIRYFGTAAAAGKTLWSAAISLNPLPLSEEFDFHIESEDILAGCVTLNDQPSESVDQAIADLRQGVVSVAGHTFRTPGSRNVSPPIKLEASPPSAQTWENVPTLLAYSSDVLPIPNPVRAAEIDNSLRNAAVPTDGLRDLLSLLALPDPLRGRAVVRLTVHPPIDLKLSECQLRDGVLQVTVVATEHYARQDIGLAVMSFPGKPKQSRQQVADQLRWETRAGERNQFALARVALPAAGNCLVVLHARKTLVRRQWYADPAKTSNSRLALAQSFDTDLAELRRKLKPARDSSDFELAVAQLGHLLGFSTSVQLQKEAPDIVLQSPAGRFAVVECTARTHDYSTKLAKLLSRKAEAISALEKVGHKLPTLAILVVAHPKAQCGDPNEARSKGVVLIAQEELDSAFNDWLRYPQDADALFERGVDSLFVPTPAPANASTVA